MGFLIRFFIRNGIHSKRTVWMAILGLIPVGCGLLLLLMKSLLQREGIALAELFPQISFYLYLHFLLPLVAVFMGSAVIADEVEDRTLPYLLVRPIPRRNIVLAKLTAGWITTGLILFISMALTYSVIMIGGGLKAWGSHIPELIKCGFVLLLGLMVYVPFFGLLGGLLKRPVLTGILFVFGWEKLVGFFPGNVKLFTIVNYLHVLFPHTQQPGSSGIQSGLLNLVMKSKQTSESTALIVLLIMAILFSLSMAMLLYIREYRLSEN